MPDDARHVGHSPTYVSSRSLSCPHARGASFDRPVHACRSDGPGGAGAALPALAQQYLYLVVRLSDQYLADHFDLPDPAQRPDLPRGPGHRRLPVLVRLELHGDRRGRRDGARGTVRRGEGLAAGAPCHRSGGGARGLLRRARARSPGSSACRYLVELLQLKATPARLLHHVPHTRSRRCWRFRSPSRRASRAWPGPATRGPG